MKFEERHIHKFHISHHLDMFLMIHVWYHAYNCELFSAWAPGLPKTTAGDTSSIAPLPPVFTQRCAERCLSHARQISCVSEKMIKVEPNHLFRDPWLSLSIYESTLIQVAAHASEVDATELSYYPKLNLRALANTRTIFVLADKTVRFPFFTSLARKLSTRQYLECCRALQDAGLGEPVVGEAENS